MTSKDPRSRRRKERANVENRLQGVYLRCDDLAEKELRVVNISELGLGVLSAEICRSVSTQLVLNAKFLVGHTIAPVQLRLVRCSAEITGFEFVAPTDLLKGVVRQFFAPELIGASLRVVKSESSSRVYETDHGARVELTLKAGVLKKFSIYVLGTRVDWDGNGFVLIQNKRLEPVPDFLLKQLVQMAQSADVIESSLRIRLEQILARVITA